MIKSKAKPPAKRDPVAVWADRITATWRKSVEAIIETGKQLLAAKAALKDGERWGTLVGRDGEGNGKLPFRWRTTYCLIAIAEDKRLVHHGAQLPPSWRTLYELNRLDDETFKRGISSGIIRPDMERYEIAALHGRQKLIAALHGRQKLPLEQSECKPAQPQTTTIEHEPAAPKVVLSKKTLRGIAAGPMAVPPSFADVERAWLEAGTTRKRLTGFLSKLPAHEINKWRAILLGIRDACDDGLDLLDHPAKEGASARLLQ